MNVFKKLIMLVLAGLLLNGCASPPETGELSRGLSGTPAQIASEKNTVKVILPVSALFLSHRTQLSSQAYPLLKTLVHTLQDYPKSKVMIIGHTDNIGADRTNIIVSEQRAKEVAHYLVKQNIHPARIQTRGLGKNYPVADNTSPANRALNRRIEIIFYDA